MNNYTKLNNIITELCFLSNSYCSENNNNCDTCKCYRKVNERGYCVFNTALANLMMITENYKNTTNP